MTSTRSYSLELPNRQWPMPTMPIRGAIRHLRFQPGSCTYSSGMVSLSAVLRTSGGTGRVPVHFTAFTASQSLRVRAKVGTPPSSWRTSGYWAERSSSSYSIIQRLKPIGLSATIQTSSS